MTERPKKVAGEDGERLRKCRIRLGYSRDEMAKALNVSAATIKNAENGYQRIAQDRLDRADLLVVEKVDPRRPERCEDIEAIIKKVVVAMLDTKTAAAVETLCETTGARKADVWVAAVKGMVDSRHC